MAKKGKQGYSQGPSTDASNTPVIDPSENVKALQIAATKRSDDLRHADRTSLRREMKLQIDSVRREMNLRAKYDAKLRKGESQRLDAIRAVDVASGVRSAEFAATAVQALAAQVPIIADQVRTNLTSTVDPILKQLAEVQRAQYEQQGQKTGGAESKSDASELASAIAGAMNPVAQLLVEQGKVLTALVDAQNRGIGQTQARVENTDTRRYNVSQNYAILGAIGIGAGILGHFIK